MAILFYQWVFIAAGLFVTNPDVKNQSSAKPLHPFYVSVTEINHNAIERNLEISCKIFTDDFETALNKSSNIKVDLFHPKDTQVVDKVMADYIGKNLVIRLDGHPVRLEFVGFERENEAIWSYYQVSKINAPKKVEITNKLLYDSFDQQINLVHVTINDRRKSSKLDFPDADLKFEF